MKVRAFALILSLCGAGHAQAEKLVVSLSTADVKINSNFFGAELTAFGSIESEADGPQHAGPYDAIVIVRGPLGAVTVAEKQAIGPLWVNRKREEFKRVPSFLSILSDHPVDEIIGPSERQKFATDINTQFSIYNAEKSDADFTSALIRLRRRYGIFGETSDAVMFLRPNLFRATISLPAYAPLGKYGVEVLAFAEGKKVAMAQTGFFVARTGNEYRLATAALWLRRHPDGSVMRLGRQRAFPA